MNTVQTAKSELIATIQVSIAKADYQADVDKALKDYQHKATMPGFRPGKVPFGMIKKMYGAAVTVDALNKKVSEALNKHITDNKLDIMGYPLPVSDKVQPADIENQDSVDFFFEIGLRPQFEVKLDTMKIDSFDITPSDAEIMKTIESIQNNNKEDDKLPELDDKLFEKIFPTAGIKDLDAFKARVAEEMKKQYDVEEDRMFLNRAVDMLVENTSFDMPDEFMKRWLVENSEGKITAEDVEKNYESNYAKSLRWQLVEEAVVKANPELIIKEEETKAAARKYFFGHTDYDTLDDEMKKRIDEIADSILKNDEQRQSINNRLADEKLTKFFKEHMKVSVKKTDYEGFVQAVLPKDNTEKKTKKSTKKAE